MAENESFEKVWRVGLGVCGGIAAYKAIEVLRGLQKAGCRVQVAMTRHATEFVQPLTFRALTGEYVLVDDYAPENPDPIAHINFSQNIDLLLIAPATANVIAKFAAGVADDFLTATYLASTAPVLIAPAMNTTMLLHPATQRNLQQLKADGVLFVEPDAGEMACGTIGPGRLSEPDQIVAAALNVLRSQIPDFKLQKDLSGERILITAGATREEIDPVRFISNYSSGKMGFALAEAARRRGAEVVLIAGTTSVEPPKDVKIVRAVSAEEMHLAVLSEINRSSIFISAAAVADYRPKNRSSEKIKKSGDNLILELEKTPDILAEVAAGKHQNLLVVGFAAETERILEHARAKFERKNLDMIVANDVSRTDAGFGTDTNEVTIITKSAEKTLGLLSKLETADRIWDEIIKLRKASE
ncbi:MAG TPA: bifunctional phosphopantothenoylcysteine decarboxylase/phosphopantothenate--cysteine ligase CoaBC [Pyrinomonadaceae bacterium]|nr:bifunctional phosphopantothenoylcysteine decarboxylase/phosphopantothenate--cysteine ligase CoaBC [Pyrinomonadaceae bacterium]